ncbi:MAG: YbfB/YjiJ family MFS transporter [Paracoccaceae bacterium]|nr:YbfB/YjiJ family MFS transporter [Paracoccaceae bacterium]
MNELSDRKKWLIVAGLSMGPAMANGFARFAYALLLPSMRADLGWTYTQAGWLNTANGIGYLIGALLALFLVGRFGPKRLFISGFALTTLAMFGSAGTPDLFAQSLCRILAGIGGAPVFVMGGVLTAALFSSNLKLNAFAVAVYFGGGGLGMLGTGLLLPTYLDSHFPVGWQMSWGFMALASCLMLGIIIWAASQVSEVREGSKLRLSGLRIGAMIPAISAYFLFGLGYVIYMTFLISWLKTNGTGTGLTSAVWSLMGIAVMASPFVWRRVLSQARAGRAIAWTNLTAGIGAFVPLFGSTFSVLISALMFGGAMFMVPTSATNFAKKSVAPPIMGAAVALFTVFFSLGQILGPIGAGYVLDQTGDSIWILLLSGSILILGMLSALLQPAIMPPELSSDRDSTL